MSNQPFWVAVQLAMKDGRHTYWKNSGDSGLPTKIEWALPEGYRVDPFLWPAPKKFGDSNITNYGYESEVIFLCKVSPPTALKEEAVRISAKVQWMECSSVCTPGKADLTLALDPGKPGDKPTRLNTDLFGRARKSLPQASAGWFLRAAYNKNKITFSMARPANANISEAYFFPEAAGQMDAGAPQKLNSKSRSYAIELWGGIGFKKNSRRLKGVLAFRDQNRIQESVGINIPISKR